MFQQDTNRATARRKATRTSEAGWQERLADAERKQWEKLREAGDAIRFHLSNRATYVHDDAVHWMAELPPGSLQAIVTDPPYGLLEYEEQHLIKRRNGSGGIWRIPPSFDGAKRSPLPRFTVLSADEISTLHGFF